MNGYDADRVDGARRLGVSIDEAFADLTGVGNLDALGRWIRSQVLLRTGIPLGVGIVRTKTLAKLANRTANHLKAKIGGVVNICDPIKHDWVLRNIGLAEVWGVGRRMRFHLVAMGIKSAMDLAKADPWLLRKNFSAVIERRHGNWPANRAWSWMSPTCPNSRSAAVGCSVSG